MHNIHALLVMRKAHLKPRFNSPNPRREHLLQLLQPRHLLLLLAEEPRLVLDLLRLGNRLLLHSVNQPLANPSLHLAHQHSVNPLLARPLLSDNRQPLPRLGNRPRPLDLPPLQHSGNPHSARQLPNQHLEPLLLGSLPRVLLEPLPLPLQVLLALPHQLREEHSEARQAELLEVVEDLQHLQPNLVDLDSLHLANQVSVL